MNGRTEQIAQSRDNRPKGFDDFELTLGDIMRGERATKGRSLLEVQRDIKIKAEYLAAIEDTDLSAFETPGFIAGYVRSYARYLGMNPDWVYRSFCDESGFSHVAGLEAQVYTKKSTRRAAPLKAGRPSDIGDAVLSRSPIYAASTGTRFGGLQAGTAGSMMVLVALVGALGYGGWSVLQQIQRVNLTPVETSLTIAASKGTPSISGPGLANEAPSTAALERLYRPQALDTPVIVARDGPIAMLDPREQGVFAHYAPTIVAGLAPISASLSLDPEPEIPEIQVVEAPPPPVVLFARNPAWVRVRAADGTVLLEKILETGERFVLPESEEPATLRAGNSGSVFFAVNGETIGPAGKGTSVAKNVVLSAVSLDEVYESADLSGDPDLARIAQLVIQPEISPVSE